MRQLLLRTYLVLGLLTDQARRLPHRPHDERGDSTVSQVLWIVFWIGLIGIAAGIITAFVEGKLSIMR